MFTRSRVGVHSRAPSLHSSTSSRPLDKKLGFTRSKLEYAVTSYKVSRSLCFCVPWQLRATLDFCFGLSSLLAIMSCSMTSHSTSLATFISTSVNPWSTPVLKLTLITRFPCVTMKLARTSQYSLMEARTGLSTLSSLVRWPVFLLLLACSLGLLLYFYSRLYLKLLFSSFFQLFFSSLLCTCIFGFSFNVSSNWPLRSSHHTRGRRLCHCHWNYEIVCSGT